MNATLRAAMVALCVPVAAVLSRGDSPDHDPLKSALADLTVNIDNVDNAGFARAGEVMSAALSASVAPARIDYPVDCLVWGKVDPTKRQPADILLIAFAAGVAQERIYGDPQISLYRGWLNVIKYYRHYHAEGTIPRLGPIEKMIAEEKSGALEARAREVQARYPALFDRIELKGDAHEFAHEFLWADCGTIGLNVPETWSEVHKEYGENAFTFIVKQKAGTAEMSVSLMQHRKWTGGMQTEMKDRFEKAAGPILRYLPDQKATVEPIKMQQGGGFIGEFAGDTLVGKNVPMLINHRVVRIAICALDDNCLAIAVMQMDTPDGPESADLMAMLTGLTFRRSGPAPVLEVTPEDGRLVLSVPVSKVRLTLPQGNWDDKTSSDAGRNSSLRYFYLVDPSRDLQISGWFESEKGYSGVKGFWASENRGNRLDAQKVDIGKDGPWDVIYYETPLPDVWLNGKPAAKLTSVNLRAELVRDGAWIDLHGSIVTKSSAKDSRAVLQTFLESLKVDEK